MKEPKAPQNKETEHKGMDDFQSVGSLDERECRNLLCRSSMQHADENGQRFADGNANLDDSAEHSGLDHFRENHPRITRIGSFFFFRSAASNTQNAAYAPSGPAVVGAALDLSMPVLFNFHLFIEAFNHIKPKDANSEAPAKILPIIFLSVLIVRSMVPPGRRGRFWSTLKFTVMSPFHRVRFRDAFVGDVLTSMVRPGQDILFALSYYVTVLWGTVTGKYGLSESGENSRGVLHTPQCVATKRCSSPIVVAIFADSETGIRRRQEVASFGKCIQIFDFHSGNFVSLADDHRCVLNRVRKLEVLTVCVQIP